MAPLASSRGGQARPARSSLRGPWRPPYPAAVQYPYHSARPRAGLGVGHLRIGGLPLATGLQAPQATPSQQLSSRMRQQDDTTERYRQSYLSSGKYNFNASCIIRPYHPRSGVVMFSVAYVYVCNAITFESLDVSSLFLVIRHVLKGHGLTSYIKN